MKELIINLAIWTGPVYSNLIRPFHHFGGPCDGQAWVEKRVEPAWNLYPFLQNSIMSPDFPESYLSCSLKSNKTAGTV